MLTEQQVRSKCLEFIQDADNSNKLKKQKDRATLAQDFFRGGNAHWTEEEYNIYKSKGVEPVSINRCRPVVKAMVGMYLQNKQDIKVLPRRGGTNTVAAIWTEVLKHTQDLTYAEKIYAELFMRGNIDTEAYIKVEIDETQNINGQPVLKVIPLEDGDVDPTCRNYNINAGSGYFIEKEWRHKEWVEVKYSDKKELFSEPLDDQQDVTASIINYLLDEDITEDEDEDLEITKKYKYRIRRIYWREIVSGVVVIDKEAGLLKIISDDKKSKQLKKLAKKYPRYEIKNTPVYRLHETVMLGKLFLEDKLDPYGAEVNRIPVFRYSPFWDLGYANSILDDIIPLNREENIHRTQFVKILNQTANSGWKVGGGNQKDIDALSNFGAVEGLVVDLSKFNGVAERLQPNLPPQGYLINSQQFEQDIKRVSGVDDATLGYETNRAESGKAISLKQKQNEVSSESIFSNFYYTLELLGNFLLKIIRKNNIYTDDEIKQVVNESSLMDTEMLAKARAVLVAQVGGELPEPMSVPPPNPEVMAMIKPEDKPHVFETIKNGIESAQMYQKEYPALKTKWDELIKYQAVIMLLQKLREDKIAEYGIKVTVSPSAPSERLARRMEMQSLAEAMPGLIPPDIMVDATDLPNKDEIKTRLQQAQQAQQAQLQRAG